MKQDTKQYISQAKAVPSELSHGTDYTLRIFDRVSRKKFRFHSWNEAVKFA